MPFAVDPISRLADLCHSGALRFVYVLGVARSNSTVVCKVLGDQLDGAVYEPLTPVAANLASHHARTILKAHDAARAGKAAGEPVVLAIKDLSLFVDDERLRFILDHAAHVVFTVRDPLTQYPSLVCQFKTEFGLRNRVEALVRWPLETMLFGYYMMRLGGGYLASAVRRFGYAPARTLLLPIAGWNLTSWGRIVSQFDAARARLGADAVSVLDAGLMRLLPDTATAHLVAIAAAVRGDGARSATPVALAAHSRMFPDSAWAGEARNSDAIKPLDAAAAAPQRPRNDFERQLIAASYPDYGHLFFDPANRLLPLVREAGSGPRPWHLIDAESADEALALVAGARAAHRDDWQSEPRTAAE